MSSSTVESPSSFTLSTPTPTPTPTPSSAPTFNGGAPVITVNPPPGQGLSSSTVAVLAYGGLLCIVVLIFTLGWVRVLIQLGVQRLSRAYRHFRGIPDPPPVAVPAIRLPSATRRNSTTVATGPPSMTTGPASLNMHRLSTPPSHLDRRHSTSSHQSSILSASTQHTSASPHLEPRAMSGPAADVLTHEDLRRLSWLQASLKGHVVLTIEPPRPGEPLVGLDDDLPRYDIGTNAPPGDTATAVDTHGPAEAAEPATLNNNDAASTAASVVSADSSSPLVPSAAPSSSDSTPASSDAATPPRPA